MPEQYQAAILRKRLRFLSCMILITACSSAFAGTRPLVQTESGNVMGVTRNGIHEFRGISYAAAPTGDLRWAPPIKPTAWSGVRDASDFGTACPQQARFNLTEGSENEDCLSLNVSVPKDIKRGERLPVLFWIHGGAFVGGASNLYRLDKLAREGRMVVVSANYRLGVFGFMPHVAFETADHYNGNYGLEDQRFAMAWVKRNIAAFGGDPKNVVIAGESAGAGSVCMHLASSERVKGLFEKAIVQSAGCLQPMKTVAEAELVGQTISSALNCSGDRVAVLACMRTIPVKSLLAQQGEYAEKHPTDFIPFAPVIGTKERPNATLPRSVRNAVDETKLVTVPLIMGGTRNEVRLYVGYWWQAAQRKDGPAVDADHFLGWLNSFYGKDNAQVISDRYMPKAGWPSAAAVPEILGSLMSDYTPSVGINNCLYLHTSKVFQDYYRRHSLKLPIYQFEFADSMAPVKGVGIAAPNPDFEMGAVHSSELNYQFPNLSNTTKIDGPDLAPASQAMADQMVAYWASFVHKGSPATKGLPVWPKYASGESVMRFEPKALAAYDADKYHQCSAFWNRLYQMP
jgi:para-nitrobenzyl esterase